MDEKALKQIPEPGTRPLLPKVGERVSQRGLQGELGLAKSSLRPLDAILGFNGRRVRVAVGPEWVRVAGRDHFPFRDYPYEFGFRVANVAAFEVASLKPTALLTTAVLLVLLALVAFTGIDERIFGAIFGYKLAALPRILIALGFLVAAIGSGLAYGFLVFSSVLIQLASGETLVFSASPTSAELYRRALAVSLGLEARVVPDP